VLDKIINNAGHVQVQHIMKRVNTYEIR